MRASIEWNPRFLSKVNRVMGRNGLLQQYITKEIANDIEPYVPLGLKTIIRGSQVIWREDWARMFYYGLIMEDPKYLVGGFYNPRTDQWWSRPGIKKIVSNRKITFRGGSRRGARWTDRWIQDNLTKFIPKVQKKAGELLRL